MRVREAVPGALAGERVDKVVALLTGCARAEVAELVSTGAVSLDGRVVHTRSARVTEGAVLEVEVVDRVAAPRPVADAGIDFAVVHADDDIVVVDKPAGLVVHPGAGTPDGTLVNGLLARFPELAAVGDVTRPGIVHRLDKGTSGLLVVARSVAAYAALVEALRGHEVDRRYLTLVRGVPEAPAGVVDAPIGRADRDRTRMSVAGHGREARTRYETRRAWDVADVALLECSLETGRTHQIRVHLSAIGHPVVGDTRYGGATRIEGVTRLGRPFLHAWRLALAHPRTGAPLRFEAPLPAELTAVLDALDLQPH